MKMTIQTKDIVRNDVFMESDEHHLHGVEKAIVSKRVGRLVFNISEDGI